MPEWLERLLGRNRHETSSPEPASTTLDDAMETARSMARPAVALVIDTISPLPDAPISSIGGAPSLPDDMEWPLSGEGAPMLFIAQINYGDMPGLPGYPETGLLSVFVEEDDLFGCTFPSREQKGFRTFYFDEPTNFTRRTPPDIPDPYSPFGSKLMTRGAPLEGRLTTALPTAGCFEAETIPTDFDGRSQDVFFDWLAEGKPGALYYGGYPDFTQFDIRSARDDPYVSEVILQLGFTSELERDWMVCWGDAGEATFLMTAEDLAERCFERAIFNWDCG